MALRGGTPPPIKLETLTAQHSIAAFSCGEPAIDSFLHTQALPEQEMGLSTVQVVCEAERPGLVIAFYTISPLSIRIDPRLLAALQIPADKQIPYPQAGGFLLGRLGVQNEFQGQGIGGSLIGIAMGRLRKGLPTTGGVFLAIDPKTERNRNSYAKLGFRQILSQNRMILKL